MISKGSCAFRPYDMRKPNAVFAVVCTQLPLWLHRYKIAYSVAFISCIPNKHASMYTWNGALCPLVGGFDKVSTLFQTHTSLQCTQSNGRLWAEQMKRCLTLAQCLTLDPYIYIFSHNILPKENVYEILLDKLQGCKTF